MVSLNLRRLRVDSEFTPNLRHEGCNLSSVHAATLHEGGGTEWARRRSRVELAGDSGWLRASIPKVRDVAHRGLAWPFTVFLWPRAACLRHVHLLVANTRFMGDFMAVLGIIIFAAMMLGLIWGLEHV
jgi:hypothetical protein